MASTSAAAATVPGREGNVCDRSERIDGLNQGAAAIDSEEDKQSLRF
jgi:hypothetical protein